MFQRRMSEFWLRWSQCRTTSYNTPIPWTCTKTLPLGAAHLSSRWLKPSKCSGRHLCEVLRTPTSWPSLSFQLELQRFQHIQVWYCYYQKNVSADDSNLFWKRSLDAKVVGRSYIVSLGKEVYRRGADNIPSWFHCLLLFRGRADDMRGFLVVDVDSPLTANRAHSH
jgi:hypothetical protein